jgi:hypothetical protein
MPEIPDGDFHAYITAPFRCEPCNTAWREWMARDDALKAAAMAGVYTLTEAEERRAVGELVAPDRTGSRLRDGLRLVPRAEAHRWMGENTNPGKMLNRGRSTDGFMWRTEYRTGLLVVTDQTSGVVSWLRVWEIVNEASAGQLEMAL